ncbi:uncharacterized protein ACB058_020957 [Synchiropus picturatus]
MELAVVALALSLIHVADTKEIKCVSCEHIKVDEGYKYEYTPFEGKIRANLNTNSPIAELHDGQLDKSEDVVDMTVSYIILRECKPLRMEFNKVNDQESVIEYQVTATQADPARSGGVSPRLEMWLPMLLVIPVGFLNWSGQKARGPGVRI